MVVEYLAELRREILAHEQVRNLERVAQLCPHRQARCRARRADRTRATCFFARRIESHVRRQDQRASGTDVQALVNRYAAFDQCIGFRDQRIKREDDAIADQALTPSRRMPDGIRCSTVFSPSMTSVWPAL